MYEDLPVSELIEKAKLNRLERLIGKSVHVVALILFVAGSFPTYHLANTIIADHTRTPYDLLFGLQRTPLCWTVFLLFAFPLYGVSLIASAIITGYAAELRTHRFRWELNRRRGRLHIEEYIRYYGKHLEPSTTICIFQGYGLPHGRRCWGCFRFAESNDPTIQTIIDRGPKDASEATDVPILETSTHSLSTTQTENILMLINRTKGTDYSHFSSCVRDGLPVELAVVFGDGAIRTYISANLAGIKKEDEQDDRIQLLRAVASVVCGER